MIVKFTVLILFVFLAELVFAESIQDIYTFAVENDFQMKAAQSAFLAGLESENISRANLLPKISVQGALSRSNNQSDRKSSNPLAVRNNSTQDIDGAGYTISLNQPIIDFVAVHNFSRSQLTVQISKLTLELQKQSLVFRTVDAYLSVLKAGDKLSAAQSAIDFYDFQLKTISKKYSLGLVRFSDVLQAQASFDAVLADKIVAENDLNISFDLLSVITGKKHIEVSAISDNFRAAAPQPDDFQQWSDLVNKNNLEHKIAKLNVDVAYQFYKSKIAERMPKVSANLSYSDNYDQGKYSDALPDRLYQRGVTGSISLSIPIYTGGGISSSAREANFLFLEKTDNANEVGREVSQKSHSFFLSTIAGVSTVNARKAAIATAQSSLTYAQKAYERGVGGIFDVLEAQKSLYEAKQNYSDALYNYLIAGLRLKESAGILSSQDVNELDIQLDAKRKIFVPVVNR